MKKLISVIVPMIILGGLSFNANARINTNYQSNQIAESALDPIKVQTITNDAITLNVRIDDIDASDPRIKSVIEYVKAHGNGVSVVFFAPDNLRYVKKVNKLFQDNHIFTDKPQFATPQHLIDLDLIKIYVIKEPHHDKCSE